MTAQEFFWCVANMRQAQRQYFATHGRTEFLRARACENEVDREIRRVKEVLAARERENDDFPL